MTEAQGTPDAPQEPTALELAGGNAELAALIETWAREQGVTPSRYMEYIEHARISLRRAEELGLFDDENEELQLDE